MKRLLTVLLAGISAGFASCGDDGAEKGDTWFLKPEAVVSGTTAEISCRTKFADGVLTESGAGFVYTRIGAADGYFDAEPVEAVSYTHRQLGRRSDRDAGDRFRSLGARMLSLRPVPSGDGGRRTPSGRAHAGDYERRRHGDGRRFGGAADALHVRALTRSEHVRDTGFGGAARRRRGNVALKYRPLLEIPEKCSLPKISSSGVNIFRVFLKMCIRDSPRRRRCSPVSG